MAELKNAVLRVEGLDNQLNRVTVVLRITAEFLPVEDAAELPVPEEAELDEGIGLLPEPTDTDEDRLATLQRLVDRTRLYVDGLKAANLPAWARAQVVDSLASVTESAANVVLGVTSLVEEAAEGVSEGYQETVAQVAEYVESDAGQALLALVRELIEQANTAKEK